MEMFARQQQSRESGKGKELTVASAASFADLSDVLSRGEIKSFDRKNVDTDAMNKNLTMVENLASEMKLAQLAQKFESFNDVPDIKKQVIEAANGKVLNICKKNQYMNLESLADMENLIMHLRFTGVPSGFENEGFSDSSINKFAEAIGSIVDAPVVINPALKVFEVNEDLHRQIADLIAAQPIQ